MSSTVIAYMGFAIALMLALCVSRAAFKPKQSTDLQALRRDIERAEQQHKPRKGLRKQMVEMLRKELEA